MVLENLHVRIYLRAEALTCKTSVEYVNFLDLLPYNIKLKRLIRYLIKHNCKILAIQCWNIFRALPSRYVCHIYRLRHMEWPETRTAQWYCGEHLIACTIETPEKIISKIKQIISTRVDTGMGGGGVDGWDLMKTSLLPNILNPYSAKGLGYRLYATLHKLPGELGYSFCLFLKS